MSDVREFLVWNQRITDFKEFANQIDGEIDYKRFPDGKEMIAVRLFYRPRKDEKNDIKSTTTKNS